MVAQPTMKFYCILWSPKLHYPAVKAYSKSGSLGSVKAQIYYYYYHHHHHHCALKL